jgi:poly-beta-1,6-N-acetyl-D-glucosamine synthase
MPAWVIAILVFGGNFTLWGTIGLFRLIDQMITHLRRRRGARTDASEAPTDASQALPGEAPPEPSEARPGEAPPEPSEALPDAGEAPVPAVAQADAAMPGKAVPARQPVRSIVDMPAAPPADELTAPLPALRPEAEPQPADELTLPLPALPVSVADAIGDIGRRGARGQARLSRARPGDLARRPGLTVDDVAVLIPAHNEAVVIEDSIRAVLKLVPAANIHVVSDGSTDDTYEIAISTGVHAITTHRNVGKAGALQEAIQRLRIVDRFSVVMLLDADTRVQAGYFDAALPMFDDPRVVAVAGCVKTTRDRKLSGTGNLLVGHRQRIYSVGQRVMKFGQTWQRTNATHIVPGFASLYRTDVLPQMEMNPPGLVIEDFNMTFEVYQKRLGKVGFSLSAIAVTQDPVNFHDYLRQTRRWALGLWQTVKRHPPRANLFSAMLALLLLELVTASLLFLMLPLVLLILAVPYLDAATLALPGFGTVHAVVAAHMSLRTVLLGVGLPDYAMTILAAIVERRPRLLLYGLLFPVLRVVDAAVGISAIPMAWLARSTGRWKSPARRRESYLEQVPGDEESAADAAAAAEVEPASVSAAR